jgi:hypothetical protein
MGGCLATAHLFVASRESGGDRIGEAPGAIAASRKNRLGLAIPGAR